MIDSFYLVSQEFVWYYCIDVVCLIIRIHWHIGPQRVLFELVGDV